MPLAAPGSPQDVLKRRYAAGEIGREQYLQTLQDLERLPPNCTRPVRA